MLGRYLFQHRFFIFSYFVCSAVFLASFWLYKFPLEAVLYPAFVNFVLSIVLFLIDFLFYDKKHRHLTAVSKLRSPSKDDLPSPSTLEDEDYMRIISVLTEEREKSLLEAEAKYADMTDYYTAWAHQIKTPIASMNLRLQNEDSEFSRKLLSDLGRIEQYADMVLAFIRLDSSSTDYVFREYELDNITKDAVKRFSGEFIARHLRLTYETTRIKLVTDEKWLSFVIEQIISNALKYTKEGGITIRAGSPDTLLITDTGIGIDESDLPRIFEKGYTGEIGRANKKASGIGLYLCKRICSNLGILISAESKPGIGTTVMLDLSQKKATIY